MKFSRRSLILAGVIGLFDIGVAKANSGIPVEVYRNPGCGCCEHWAAVMTEAGFSPTMAGEPELDALRSRAGVPEDLASCHTAFVDDFVIEGHVPSGDVILFLAERPKSL